MASGDSLVETKTRPSSTSWLLSRCLEDSSVCERIHYLLSLQCYLSAVCGCALYTACSSCSPLAIPLHIDSLFFALFSPLWPAGLSTYAWTRFCLGICFILGPSLSSTTGRGWGPSWLERCEGLCWSHARYDTPTGSSRVSSQLQQLSVSPLNSLPLGPELGPECFILWVVVGLSRAHMHALSNYQVGNPDLTKANGWHSSVLDPDTYLIAPMGLQVRLIRADKPIGKTPKVIYLSRVHPYLKHTFFMVNSISRLSCCPCSPSYCSDSRRDCARQYSGRRERNPISASSCCETILRCNIPEGAHPCSRQTTCGPCFEEPGR